jgi:uncharacterized phage-associated protein
MMKSAMAVSFTFDQDKATAAVAFLASQRVPDLTKGKICKLIFLADKHHLVRFGRPVTGDRICAMKDGPVPSSILNMLNEVLANPSGSRYPLLQRSVSINRTYSNPHFEAGNFELGDFLSESDVESLNAVVHAYGQQTFSELRRITHDMPAYKKAWSDERPHNSPEMAFEDFFEEDDEAILGAFEEMIDNYKLREAFASSGL